MSSFAVKCSRASVQPRSRLRFAAAFLVVAACTPTAPDPIASTSQPMMGGVLSDRSDDAVIRLDAVQSVVLQTCTGALIAPNLVITAKHCIADYVSLPFTCDALGDLVAGPGGTIGTEVAPNKVSIKAGPVTKGTPVVAYGKRIFSLPTTTICQNDIALVVLDRDVTGLTPLPIRLDRGTVVGEHIRAIGYGISEDGDAGLNVRHTKANLLVTQVGTSQYNRAGDSIPPRSFQVDQTGLCMGDSGGPALSDQGAVIGVVSKYTGVCDAETTVTYYTETGPFSDELIRPAFAAAGYDPLLESPPGAAGAAGSTGDVAGAAGNSNGVAGAAGSPPSAAGASPIGGGGTPSTDTVRGGTPGTDLATGGRGGSATAATASTGDGGEDVVYDGGPPKGGSCSCKMVGVARRNLTTAALLAALLLRARRRKSVPHRRAHECRGTDSTAVDNQGSVHS